MVTLAFRRAAIAGALLYSIGFLGVLSAQREDDPAPRPSPRQMVTGHEGSLFITSENCIACHNGLASSDGEDVSIGTAWRATMMANSARDPYWQASVRRETLEHPESSALIERECSVCHMPMSHTSEVARAEPPRVFAHLPLNQHRDELGLLAGDGVSCAICHQIRPEKLGTPESFSGGYVIDLETPFEERQVFGPFKIERGQTRIMNSATGLVPTEGTHVRQSEMCATCHTLFTTALGPDGTVIGSLPEQVPYLEWQHSDFRETQSCQHCHMPAVAEPTRIASVLGEPREGMSRHTFRGGNFFMLRLLNRYRSELDVPALPAELDREALGTLNLLAQDTARLSINQASNVGGRISLELTVENITGHKLPTAYPSRRVWLHVRVRGGDGAVVFESGRMAANGAIDGNDNDRDASRFEDHYSEVTSPEQVQIYESIMADSSGRPTTGLLNATRYLKDNRLLPQGFDKTTAGKDIAVTGTARDDDDFTGGADRVRYVVDTGGAAGPFTIEAELLYQPIAFRWARNLEGFQAPEPQRFLRYYDEMAAGGAAALAKATVTLR